MKDFKVYIILSLLYGIYGFIDTLFISGKRTLGQIPGVYLFIVNMIVFGFFIYAIVSLVMFINKKYPKYTWVMPIYHILIKIFIFIYGIVWGMVIFFQGGDINQLTVLPGLVVLAYVTSGFELIFCIWALKKLSEN